MSEFKIGDAVRIKGQRGRPQKWIIAQMGYAQDEPIILVQYSNRDNTTAIFDDKIALYPVKAEKITEVVTEVV
jgi:hypothetical protein